MPFRKLGNKSIWITRCRFPGLALPIPPDSLDREREASGGQGPPQTHRPHPNSRTVTKRRLKARPVSPKELGRSTHGRDRRRTKQNPPDKASCPVRGILHSGAEGARVELSALGDHLLITVYWLAA